MYTLSSPRLSWQRRGLVRFLVSPDERKRVLIALSRALSRDGPSRSGRRSPGDGASPQSEHSCLFRYKRRGSGARLQAPSPSMTGGCEKASATAGSPEEETGPVALIDMVNSGWNQSASTTSPQKVPGSAMIPHISAPVPYKF